MLSARFDLMIPIAATQRFENGGPPLFVGAQRVMETNKVLPCADTVG